MQSILEATAWFSNPTVQVREGVVFLKGQTATQEYKNWAGDLARNTQDVAAVVNQIELTEPSAWNFQPALAGLREIRLVKRAFQSEAISMPDEAREMIFPQGVSVRLLEPDGGERSGTAVAEPVLPRQVEESGSVSTQAEAGLRSEAEEIQEQAAKSRQPEEGENLLKPAAPE